MLPFLTRFCKMRIPSAEKKMGFFSNFVKVFPPPPRFYKQKEENRVLAHRALRT
jgi:hypothetical protein